MTTVAMPRSWARRMINASDELPKVNTSMTARNPANGPRSTAKETGCFFTAARCSRTTQPMMSSVMAAITPATKKIIWYLFGRPAHKRNNANTIKGPATEPRVSRVRWIPKANPKLRLPAELATRASRGASLSPLPTPSVIRKANTTAPEPARPMENRARADRAYPTKTMALRFPSQSER